MRSDQLGALPVQRNQKPSEQDIRVMETVFGRNVANSGNGVSLSSLIIPGILFFVLSLPFVDKFIRKYLSTSDILLLSVKTGIFVLLLMILQLIGWA